MNAYSFGNDPGKIANYRAFWERSNVDRPIIGFTQVGWFPLEYFSACKSWQVDDRITPDMMVPEEWLDDTEKLLLEGERIPDDIIRGACPTQVAMPCFLAGALGSPIRVLPNTVLPEELKLSWDDALAVSLDENNPWVKTYRDFAGALARKAGGRYPVSHNAELGPTDLQAVIRGHNEALIDLLDSPEQTAELLFKLGEIFAEFTEGVWEQLPLFHGGYFDSQYQLWAPGPIIRMQEDATASYSPELYRRFVQPVDRMLAERFTCSFIHLHSTSMHILDGFLEIEALRCFEINIEPFTIPMKDMIPYFRTVQEEDRCLLVRGSFVPDELRMLLDSLDPRGLYVHIIIEDISEVDALGPVAGL